MKAQIKEVIERVKTETPTHFNRLKKFGLGLAGTGLLVKLALAVFPGTMPIGLAAIAGDLVYVGLTMAGVSITAKK
jgi:hypothetical protein